MLHNHVKVTAALCQWLKNCTALQVYHEEANKGPHVNCNIYYFSSGIM